MNDCATKTLHATASVTDAPGGNQWMVDLHGCGKSSLELREAVRAICLDAVTSNGLTPVGEVFHQFEPHGVTGVIVLAESHLAVHTWPEHRFVSVDLYVCSLTQDNRERGDAVIGALIEGFGAKAPSINRQPRAAVAPRVAMASKSGADADADAMVHAPGGATAPRPSISW